MKYVLLFSILFFFTSCTSGIKSCDVKPSVKMRGNVNLDLLRDAVPRATVKCPF